MSRGAAVVARMVRARDQLLAAERDLSGSRAAVADAVAHGALDRLDQAKDEASNAFQAFYNELEREGLV
jgi:peptidyl-tRNA hydrolase